MNLILRYIMVGFVGNIQTLPDFEAELKTVASSLSEQSDGLYSVELSPMDYKQLPAAVKKMIRTIRENLITDEDSPIHCEGYSRYSETLPESWQDSGWVQLWSNDDNTVAYCRCAVIESLKTIHIFGFHNCNVYDEGPEDSSRYDLFFERFAVETGEETGFARHVLIKSVSEKPSTKTERSRLLGMLIKEYLDVLGKYIDSRLFNP